MAKKQLRALKSETLSIRLDPKTKFTLEFVARIKGQTLTVVVERAIRDSCDSVRIGAERNNEGSNWSDFWDPAEGVRTLGLLNCPDYPSSYDEDDLRQFTRDHWPFFYRSNSEPWKPDLAFVQILWPKIQEYRRVWRERKNTDYWAAGRAMEADLSAAQVKPPSWPPTSPPSKTSGRTFERAELDDEIPF
jgi:hypothetical protein